MKFNYCQVYNVTSAYDMRATGTLLIVHLLPKLWGGDQERLVHA